MNHIKKYLHLAGMMAVFLIMAGCGEKQTENADVLINSTTEENVTETTAKEYVTEEITTEETVEETTEETTKEPVVIDIPHEEEIRTLIEMYNECQNLIFCSNAEGKKLITAVGSEYQWGAYTLSSDKFSTLEELDTYWRRYFTEAYYEQYVRKHFFEYDGNLCIYAIEDRRKQILFETVSDFKETETGFEAYFDRERRLCMYTGTCKTEKVKVNFVWEDDVLKISEIERLE